MAGIHGVQEPTMTKNTMKAFIPTEYFQHVGYEIPKQENSTVTSKTRTDSLGQRVRDRFNEDLAYKDPAPKQLKLTTKILSDQKSQTSSIRMRSTHSSYKRPISQQSRLINDYTIS